MIKIPKIEFIPLTLEENIETIKWAYYDNNGEFSILNLVLDYFPELKKLNSENKEIVFKAIEEVVTDDYKKYKNRIHEEVNRYNHIWKKYDNKYLTTLSSYLEIDWPDNIDVIKAKVGLIPVFPRYLDEFSFSISTGVSEEKLIETTAHETLHFLWFEKWKEIHPETSRREYDSPYLPWKYSEMVTDPILNNEPFTNMFNFTERGYDNFYEMYDNNELVMNKLRNIYSKNISITEKINEGYDYLKQYNKGTKKRK